MDRLAAPLLLLFAGLSAPATRTVARPEWRRHFEAPGARGTCVVFEPARDRRSILDEPRARTRLSPAATFQVAGALIGIDAGAIGDENEVFRWDGRPRPRPELERDHTLASGMRDGAAWMFQEVARRTGKVAMRDGLARLDYGNRDISGGIDLFWLQGGLRVSALEQVAFLHRLAEGRLGASQRAQRLVRQAMLVERTRDYALFAQAGCGGSVKEPVRWWVGWVERKGRIAAVFALNLAPGPSGADPAAIGRAILAADGVLPSEFPPA
jgi:beta-lactamase class D